MAIPKLLEAACKGTHLPDYGGPENADGPAVRTGAWIADVTYERAASQPESANNLKQIVLAVHALDAGECSVDICAQNSPSASPAPDNSSRGYTAGHFALELEGHNASMPTVDYGTGSFTIANTGNPATVDANLVFDSTGGGGRSTVLLPYIEQHGGEADDGGVVINWTTTGDGPKGGDSVDVIAIITPTEHGGSVLEFSVAFPNNSPSPAPGESASFQGFVIDHGHMGRSFDLVFPTQTAFPEVSGLKIEQDVIEFSPHQAVSVIAIIAPVDLDEVDVGHADLLFSEDAPGGAGCSVYICGQNSPQASPAPVDQRGYAGGHFELVLDGHSSSPANTGYVNPSSFQIVSAGPSPLESDYSGAHALYQDVMIV